MATIKSEPTPNPDSLKFSASGHAFVDQGMAAFASAREAEGDPLASRLFSVGGVANVFVTPGFLTVTKEAGAHWDLLMPKIKGILQDHVASSEG